MKNRNTIKTVCAAAALLAVGCLALALAHEQNHPSGPVQSVPGTNQWNLGEAPADWYGEMRRYHGHVGPWNVLGWRLGRAAMRDLKSAWGRHELELIVYLPLRTPFTCLLDGLSVGTGNSQGRLDLRLAEVFTWEESFVAVRRKDGRGGVLEYRFRAEYLQSILDQPFERLEALSQAASQMPEAQLFTVRQCQPAAKAL